MLKLSYLLPARPLPAFALFGLLLCISHPAHAQDAATPADAATRGGAPDTASEAADPAPQQAAADQADPALANMAPDPPDRVARLSVVEGEASIEAAGASAFSAAEVNYPLTTGDRLYAGDNSMAELQTGQVALQLGATTDLTLVTLSSHLAQFGLAGGSVRLRAFSLEPDSGVELDTPNVAITLLQPSDLRIDTDPNSYATTLTVTAGQVQVQGNDFDRTLNSGDSIQLKGLNPLEAASGASPQQDALDQFAESRDEQFLSGEQGDGSNVSDATVGAEDLSAYGDWSTDNDNDPVWFPSGVAVDWEPYRFGHWIWLRRWGWTWVETEPWGFAPFHYGRWERLGGRWGWVPGPTAVHPIWAPALVVFLNGGSLAGANGPLVAWAPLGPREPFVPWYTASGLYTNRVNAADIYNRDSEAVRALYNQRTLDLSFGSGVAPRSFVYRRHATVISQSAFASGKPVASALVRLPAQELAHATVETHPDIAPVPQPSHTARAIPPAMARPLVSSRSNQPGAAGFYAASPAARASAEAHSGATGTPHRTQPANTQHPQPRSAQPRPAPPAQNSKK
jgi:hypothetical protein